MTKLLLYTTLGCHLCEQAEELVTPLIAARGWILELVEISDSDELVERYGLRIPVLLRMDNQQELGWPFDQEMLESYLR